MISRRVFCRLTAATALFAGIACISTFADAAPSGAPPVETARPTLYLIGDSTVKNGTKGLQGWGTPIAGMFDPAKINVVNRALGGRSSRTFLTEGLWDKVRDTLKPGDFVLMQFGHNDGGSIHTSTRASLKGGGPETQDWLNPKTGKTETVQSYGWYLRKYIADAKAKGVNPIVLSPVPRNIWKDGKVGRAANDYGKWAKEAAGAEHVPFVDLNEIIAAKYETLGETEVKKLFPGDHTHTSPEGALLNAASVVQGVRGLQDCPLGSYALPMPPALVALPTVR